MNIFKKINVLFLFLTISTILSCSTDENDILQDSELVGVWLRNDSNDNFEYKLYLNSDNKGLISSSEYQEDGNAISNAESLNWSTSGDQLTIYIADENYNGTYTINSDGQLLFNGLSYLPFNKVE